MNLPSLVTDNISELLVTIIKFTRIRKKIITENLNNSRTAGYVPKDVEVDKFSELLSRAIDEHTRNKRLLLSDTKNIKFGANGDFEVSAVVDEDARELLSNSHDEYVEMQINKLLENSLNQRIAKELLEQKQGFAVATE